MPKYFRKFLRLGLLMIMVAALSYPFIPITNAAASDGVCNSGDATITAPATGAHVSGAAVTVSWTFNGTDCTTADPYLLQVQASRDAGATWTAVLATAATQSSTSVTFDSTGGSTPDDTDYLFRLKNGAGAIVNTTSYSDVEIDNAVPTISSRETKDLDGDGKIDAVKITLSDEVLDSSVTATDFDVAGYVGEAFSSTTNGDTANNTVIYITFTEGGATDTEATPNLTYTAGTLTDLAGNALATNGPTATTDKAAPALAEVTPVTTPTNDNTPNVVVSASEIGTISWAGGCNSATANTADGNNTITLDSDGAGAALADAAYSCTITATDAGGNANSALSLTAFTVDTTVPVFSSVTPAATTSINSVTTSSDVGYTLDTAVASGTITVTRTGGTADAGSPHTCTLTGTGLTSGAHTIDFSDTTNGCSSAVTLVNGTVYTFAFDATDAASNAAVQVSRTNVTFDTTAPTISETTPVTTPTNDTTPAYTFTSNEAGTISYGGSCTSGTTAGSSGANAISFSALAEGTYSNCTVTVTDAAGNASNVLSVTAFTIDTTVPVFSSVTPTTSSSINNVTTSSDIAYTLSEAVASGTVTITRTGGTADGGSPHTCTLAGTALNSGAHTLNLADTTNGCSVAVTLVSGTIYTFAFDATDAATNPAVQVSRTDVTFDSTAPTLTETTPVTTPTNDNTPAYVFNTNEAGTISYGGDCSSATTSASSGDNSVDFTTLADGAHSNCTVTVTDAVGNASTPLSVTAFTVDTAAPVFSSVTPTASSTIDNVTTSSDIGYTLDTAVASGTITITRTGGTADAGSPHTCTLLGTGLNSGAHVINVTDTVNGCAVSQTLVDGAIYTFTFDSTDAAGNTATQVSRTSVTLDTTVPAFSLVTPTASSTINNVTTSSDVGYTLSEAVASGTITVTRTGGTADASSPHTCTLAGTALNSGAHTINFSDTTNGCSSAVTLVDGTIYTFAFDATDSGGNPAVQVSRTSVTFDTTAPSFSSVTPTASSTINNVTTSSDIGYTLSEAVASGTVTITRTGGTADGGSPHTCTLAGTALNSGAHTLDVSDTVNGCAVALTLVDGAIYTFAFDATDAGGNTAVQVSNASVTLDTTVPAFSSVTPAATTSINNVTSSSDVGYTLSEAVASGTITVTRTGGTADASSPHTCTLTGTGLNSGAHTIDFSDTTNGCSSAVTLVNGTIYTFAFDATDAGGNAAVQVSRANVTFDTTAPTLSETTPVTTPTNDNTPAYTFTSNEAGTITYGGSCNSVTTAASSGANTINLDSDGAGGVLADAAYSNCTITVTDAAGNVSSTLTITAFTIDTAVPVFSSVSPTASTSINNVTTSSDVGYTLDTAVASGTITITRTGGTADASSPHTCTLAGTALNSGAHTINLSDTTNGCSTAVTLVDGAIYTFAFDATDAATNAAVQVSRTSVTFDTTAPAFSSVTPAASSTINNVTTSSDVGYTLSEAVASGTVVITRTGGTADGGSPHTCTLAGTALNSGAHTLDLSDTTNGCSSAVTLVDGAIYTFAFDATDAAANTATQVSNASVIFDTTVPAFSSVTPAASSTINNVTTASDIAYTLSEAVASGTVTITRTGGTADASSPHTCTLAGTALNSGAHTLNLADTTNGCSSAVTLVSGTVYTFAFDATDAGGNTAVQVSNTSVTFDSTAPVISQTTPVTTPTNDSTPAYTFTTSEAGTITYGGSCTSGTTSASLGANTISFSALADGAYSNCTVTVTDAASNASNVLAVTAFTVDTTLPVFSSVTPANSAFIDNVTTASDIGYSLSEAVASGSITITRTSGTADPGSPHTCTLAGTALNSGAHSINLSDTTNGCSSAVTLMSGTVYTFVFNATDAATNAAAAVTRTSVTLDQSGPTFVNSTPATGAVSVSVSAGSVTVNYNENIAVANQSGITIAPAAGGASVKNGSASATTTALTINYNALSYGTSYKVTIPAAAVTDTGGNAAAETVIYFTTQSATAPDITGVSTSGITNSAATINWSTDVTPDSGTYRYSTTPYGGSWTALTIGGASGTQALSSLSANTTYYYQVGFTKNGATVYSVPVSFTTSSASTGISVDSIQMTDTYATADDTYGNGWAWRFNITINDTTETDVAMKFAQWVSGSNTLNAASNMRYSIDNATWTTISANATYGSNIDVSAVDTDATKGGRQVTLYVQMKVPTGTAGGSYSTSYGVQST